MNSVALIGWLVKDPELKKTVNGKPYCAFTLGVKKYNNEDCDFIDCLVWGASAEALVLYQKKGDRLGIEGRIEKNVFEKEDGSGKMYKVQVVTSYIDFLSTRKKVMLGDELY